MKVLSCLFLFLLAGIATAQQPACSAELPVGVLAHSYSFVDDFTAKDVVVRADKQVRSIESLKFDTGSRRILLVLDNSPHLALDVRKVEVKLLNYLVASARTEDSFALITARGIPHSVKFGEARESVLNTAEALLKDDPKDKTPKQGIFDAMMSGIGFFGAPQTGDALIILAPRLDDSPTTGTHGAMGSENGNAIVYDDVVYGPKSQTSFRTVRDALYDHHIRAFGFQLGKAVFAPEVSRTTTDENLFGLAYNSGGYAAWENTEDPWKAFQLTEARWEVMKDKAWKMYGAIAQVYLLRVPVNSTARLKWDLKLPKDLEKNTYAIYPHELAGCPSLPSTAAQQ